MERPIQIQLQKIGEADMIIGVPSYNNAGTISQVVQTIATAIGKNFPRARAVLINSDGESTDGTQEEVKKVSPGNLKILLFTHSVPPVDKILSPYHGIPGKENALRVIFESAQSLKAKAGAVFDPSVKSITAQWVRLLADPILKEGFDYVAPVYTRHPSEGTINNGIVYPLVRALYGKRIRQPIASDFGFSGELAKLYLAKEAEQTEVARLAADLWLTTLAITGGGKVGQSYLGPRIQESREPKSNLGSMFTQVLSCVFRLMEDGQDFWKRIHETQPVLSFGSAPEESGPPLSVNVERMIANFRLGIQALMELWSRVLSPGTGRRLISIGRLTDSAFSFPSELWVQVVYDFAVAFHHGSMNRDHLLKSMIPLYLGWAASFIKENQESPPQQAEERIESLCQVFEKMKPYFLERWG
jgi:hypothetical protein